MHDEGERRAIEIGKHIRQQRLLGGRIGKVAEEAECECCRLAACGVLGMRDEARAATDSTRKRRLMQRSRRNHPTRWRGVLASRRDWLPGLNSFARLEVDAESSRRITAENVATGRLVQKRQVIK